MPDVDAFLEILKDEIVHLADEHFEEFRDQAVRDGTAFLHRTEDDLRHWAQLLEDGKLSRSELASLVRGQKDLAEMTALKRAGLAAAEADRFRNALLDRVIGTAVRVLL
jgi:hypothetical protein